MPSHKLASFLHAAYYLRVLYDLNADYLQGGKEQIDSLTNFEHERLNVFAARDKLPELATQIDRKQPLSEIDRALLDMCNTFPDAGAYLISMKLNATVRIRWLMDALQASRELENDVTAQAHLGNLGLAYSELGDLSLAIQYFTQALQLAEKLGDKYHQGAWLGNLGNNYALMGDHEKAIEYHKRHLALAREIQDTRGEGHALANLGVSYAYFGNAPKALEHYQQYLALAVKSGDRREESQALMNLGFACFDMGDLDAAERSLKAALSISGELGDQSTQSFVMGGLADIQIERGEYPLAIRALQQAIGILQNTYNINVELHLLHSLGNAYSASEDYDHALETYSRLYTLAESVGARAAMCSALTNQISVYRRMGNLARALKIGKKGLALAKEVNSLSDEAFIRWQTGLIYEARAKKDKARVEMELAIEIESKIGSLEIEQHRNHIRDLYGIQTDCQS
jgi:tetratricopeptide (TPR) repeat protein